jgi:hypothetical protein
MPLGLVGAIEEIHFGVIIELVGAGVFLAMFLLW